MNFVLVFAAALVFALGAAHSYLGERHILIRLFRRADLPELFGSDQFTRRTLRFAWHITTIAWWGFGLLLLAAALSDDSVSRTTLGAIVSGTFLVSGLVALVASRGRHRSWPVFLVIAAAAWFGLR